MAYYWKGGPRIKIGCSRYEVFILFAIMRITFPKQHSIHITHRMCYTIYNIQYSIFMQSFAYHGPANVHAWLQSVHVNTPVPWVYLHAALLVSVPIIVSHWCVNSVNRVRPIGEGSLRIANFGFGMHGSG